MNTRQIVASLNKIANQLDHFGQHDEANLLTSIMVKLVTTNATNYNITRTKYKPKNTKETVANMRNMARSIQDVSLTCQSLLNNDEISQSHIDSLSTAEKELTPLKNLLKMYIGKRLL
jgi:hypothetical protein